MLRLLVISFISFTLMACAQYPLLDVYGLKHTGTPKVWKSRGTNEYFVTLEECQKKSHSCVFSLMDTLEEDSPLREHFTDSDDKSENKAKVY